MCSPFSNGSPVEIGYQSGAQGEILGPVGTILVVVLAHDVQLISLDLNCPGRPISHAVRSRG